jgi:hypothetical protein
MALHVDIVKNDWLAGVQYPLATLQVGANGRITVEAEYPERWRNIVDDLNDARHPGGAVASLHTRMNGSHLFATKLHSEGSCPYRTGPVYLRGHDVSRTRPAPPVPVAG